jgi:hypothetical protein
VLDSDEVLSTSLSVGCGESPHSDSNISNSRPSLVSLDEITTISLGTQAQSPKVDCEARVDPSTQGACEVKFEGFQSHASKITKCA